MLKWLLGTKNTTSFPTKTGINAASCVSLLDLHGSLFCLDNQNILFYEDGTPKVIKPVAIKPMEDETLKDYDAFDINKTSFAIRYKGRDYVYQAQFEVTKLRDNTYIKIKDVTQEVFNTVIKNGCVVTQDGEIV